MSECPCECESVIDPRCIAEGMCGREMPPGSSWTNPIWHREKWRIYMNDGPWGHLEYVHDDYDGAPDANDGRCGHADTIAECMAEIDERFPPEPTEASIRMAAHRKEAAA